jgi:hypothetical protein
MLKTRYLFVLLGCLLLAACSSKSFFYNRLDWLIPWYVEDYVDLTAKQREYFDVQLAPFLSWHREEELNRYIGFLGRIEQDIAGDVSPAMIRLWVDEAMLAVRRSQSRLLEVGIDLAGRLDDQQMVTIGKRLMEKQAELEQEYLSRSDKEYTDDTYDRLADRLDDYMGRLDSEQRQTLREASAELVRLDRAWLSDRRAWLEAILPLLAREPGWEDAIRQQANDRFEYRSVAYRQALEHNLGLISTAVASVLNNRDRNQQSRLVAELADLRHELQELNQQVAEETPSEKETGAGARGFNPFVPG